MNRTSYSLALVASIMTVAVFIVELAIALFAAFAVFLTTKVFEGLSGQEQIRAHIYSGSFAAAAVVFASVVAAAVLGFLGLSRLRKDGRRGGSLLIAAGSLMLAAAGAGFCVHWLIGGAHCAVMALYMAGGALAVIKCPARESNTP